jgi:penicillin-binding protein 1A
MPRTKDEWRAALADAADVGERIGAPRHPRALRTFRIILLLGVVTATSMFLLLLSTPFVAFTDRSVASLVERFGGPIEDVELPEIAQRSVVVDRDGRVIATLAGVENRKVVPLDRIAKIARQAVIAVEDADFYVHNGVDLTSLLRAFLTNIRAGGIAQGGSTITQQLVKNTLVGTERSIDRKILEARLALRLEQELSKREILETYLNEAYFGNGVYGIGTAAEYYFGIRAVDLDAPQAALLAGIIKAPEVYEPFGSPEDAARRRAYALSRMRAEGLLTDAEVAGALATPLPTVPHRLKPSKSPYVVEVIKAQILADERFGDTVADRAAAIFQAGLRIETTIDLDLQRAAQTSVEKVLDQPGDPDAALASIDAKTGAVLAIVGGRDFETEKFNLATQGRRQPGSTFKPFTMVAALETGFTPSLVFDTPSPLLMERGGERFTVNNYSGHGEGLMDMRDATAFSVNTYYIQLIDRVGPAAVAELGNRLGIETDLPAIYSLALGTVEVTPFELASAYATLANRGTRCEPFSILRVRNPKGEVLLRNEPECEEVLDPNVAALASDILREVPERGTGQTNGQIGRPVTGKTGTTDEYSDAWYVGYTPQIATTVWLGFAETNGEPLYGIHGYEKVYGGSLPAMIWSRYMRAAHEGLDVEAFPTVRKPGYVEAPDVVGLDVRDALELLEQRGFFTVDRRQVKSAEPQGTVVAQSPVAGSRVGQGSYVKLKISSGTAPEASPSPTPSLSKTKRPKPRPTRTSSPTPSLSQSSSPPPDD